MLPSESQQPCWLNHSRDTKRLAQFISSALYETITDMTEIKEWIVSTSSELLDHTFIIIANIVVIRYWFSLVVSSVDMKSLQTDGNKDNHISKKARGKS
jgi:hypothetical protein